jgi:hypothetical protein
LSQGEFFGKGDIAEQAKKLAGKDIPVKELVVDIRCIQIGERSL